MIRIILDEKDFTTLVQGGVVSKKEGEERVEIILQDIGFTKMENIILKSQIQQVYANKKS